jgi:hypothetical protein
MSDAIEPSWSVFGPCKRCGAVDGAPCVDMRGQWAVAPTRVWVMRNPHLGRKKVRN